MFSKLMVLGDSSRYTSALPKLTYWVFIDSTLLTDFIAGTISMFLGSFLTHFAFFNLSFFSLVSLLKTAKFDKSLEIKIMFFTLLPSYSIWSSLAGKEVITISITCYIASAILLYDQKKVLKNKLLLLIFFLLLGVFKIQYVPAFASIFLILWLRKNTNKPALSDLTVFLLLTFIMFTLLYAFYDTIALLSLAIPQHFSESARLTRDNIFFVEHGDIFDIRPDYWLLSFWGLSFSEAIKNPIDFIFFIESTIIFAFIIYLVIYKSHAVFSKGQLKTLNFIVFIFLFGILLLVHYPMGIMNAGSAMRYRSGFLSALIVLLAYFPALYASSTRKYKENET